MLSFDDWKEVGKSPKESLVNVVAVEDAYVIGSGYPALECAGLVAQTSQVRVRVTLLIG